MKTGRNILVLCAVPVLERGNTAVFFEAFGEVELVTETQIAADFFNAGIGMAQPPLGGIDQLHIDILFDGDTNFFAELPGQVASGNIALLCQFVDSQLGGKPLIDIVDGISHTAGIDMDLIPVKLVLTVHFPYDVIDGANDLKGICVAGAFADIPKIRKLLRRIINHGKPVKITHKIKLIRLGKIKVEKQQGKGIVAMVAAGKSCRQQIGFAWFQNQRFRLGAEHTGAGFHKI